MRYSRLAWRMSNTYIAAKAAILTTANHFNNCGQAFGPARYVNAAPKASSILLVTLSRTALPNDKLSLSLHHRSRA